MSTASSGCPRGRTRHRGRLAVAVGVLALVCGGHPVLAGSVGPTVPAPLPVVPDLPESATDAGEVTIVSAADRTDELTEGDTNSVFSVRIPSGSVCPGDSANDDWRVQTFIVPADTDVGSLAYGATRPRGEFMYGLYTTEGRPYVQVLLGQNPEPGLPGQILDPPPLSFAPFTPDLLPVGRYRIGVACSYFEVGERYWDTEIELTEDTDVQPGERRWTVVTADGTGVAAPADDGGGSTSLTILAIAVTAAAIAAGGLIAFRRRQPPVLAKEHAR